MANFNKSIFYLSALTWAVVILKAPLKICQVSKSMWRRAHGA